MRWLKKGKKVCVTGAVSISKWTGRDGENRSGLEIKAAEACEFLSPKDKDAEPAVTPAPAKPEPMIVDDDELPF